MIYHPGVLVTAVRQRPIVWIALGYVLLTVAFAWPFSAHTGTRVLAPGTDTDLPIWTIGWDVHAFFTKPWALFDANIFFPYRNTLAYSENSLGAALMAAPWIWLTGNTTQAMNLVVLLSTPLVAIGTYGLGRVLGLSRTAALVAGFVAAFAPVRFLRLEQFHVANTGFMPFTLAALHLYLRDGRARDLRMAVACFSAQAVTSGHGGAMTLFAVGVVLVWAWLQGAPVVVGRRLGDLGWPGLLALAPVALVFVPYRMAARDIGLTRVFDDWTVNLVSFVSAPSRLDAGLVAWATSRWPDAAWLQQPPDVYLFPGLVPLLMGAYALVAASRASRRTDPLVYWRAIGVALNLITLAFVALACWVAATGSFRLRLGDTLITSHGATPWIQAAVAAALRALVARKTPVGWWTRPRAGGHVWLYAALFLLCVWLAVGPPLGLWSLIKGLPGLTFIRVPSRFMVLGVLALGIVVGFGIDQLRRHRGRVFTVAAAVAVAGLVIETVPFEMTGLDFDATPPAIDRYVATRDDVRAILEAPLSDSRGDAAREQRTTRFMLHSMAHWKPIFQGFSGAMPPTYMDDYRTLTHFPDSDAMATLRRLGISHVVLHLDLVPADERAVMDERLAAASPPLELVHAEGDGRLYRVR